MKSILAIAILFFSVSGFAVEVCYENPETAKADNITTNFDGSVTYTGAMVAADGDFRRVTALLPITAASGLCVVWQKGTQIAFDTAFANDGEVVAEMNADGTFGGTTTANGLTRVVTNVTCKPGQ